MKYLYIEGEMPWENWYWTGKGFSDNEEEAMLYKSDDIEKVKKEIIKFDSTVKIDDIKVF
jgi:hypothetical protein